MEKIHKRLTAATKFIFIIFTVCLVFLFHKIQNENSQKDYNAVGIIVNNAGANAASVNELDEQARKWLAKYFPDKFKLHYFARVQLSDLLLKNGIDSTQIINAKRNETNERFSILRIGEVFSSKGPIYGLDQKPFADLMDAYLEKASNRAFYLVTGMDTAKINFKRVADALYKTNSDYVHFLEEKAGQRFSKKEREEGLRDPSIKELSVAASLINDSIQLSFTSTSRMSQRYFIPIEITFPATVVKLDTLVSLFSITGKEKDIIDSAELGKLRSKYGSLPTEVVKKQAAAKYLSYFDDIDILGFKIPYESFFIITFIFEFLLSLSILNSILVSKKSGWGGVFAVVEDDLFGPLVSGKLLRALSWILIPAASILLAYPGRLHYSLPLLICLIVLFGLYIPLFVFSLSVEKNSKKDTV